MKYDILEDFKTAVQFAETCKVEFARRVRHTTDALLVYLQQATHAHIKLSIPVRIYDPEGEWSDSVTAVGLSLGGKLVCFTKNDNEEELENLEPPEQHAILYGVLDNLPETPKQPHA